MHIRDQYLSILRKQAPRNATPEQYEAHRLRMVHALTAPIHEIAALLRAAQT
jgi:hypothetical protein